MSRASIWARLKRLEARRDVTANLGTYVLPRDIDPSAWAHGVQWELAQMSESPVACEQCGQPTAPEMDCMLCDEPLPTLTSEHHAPVEPGQGFVVSDPFEGVADWLHRTQRRWCEESGIRGYCRTCLYPMAEGQRRCLMCLSTNLYGASTNGNI